MSFLFPVSLLIPAPRGPRKIRVLSRAESSEVVCHRMAIFAALVLAGMASATPLFQTSSSSELGGHVLKHELYDLPGQFQSLHAAEVAAVVSGVGDGESSTSGRRSARLASMLDNLDTLDSDPPPSPLPSALPSFLPSSSPSNAPTQVPTLVPTQVPTITMAPTWMPSVEPTMKPVSIPTALPTAPLPTASDTVKVYVAVEITSTTALTSTLAKQLKGTIASQINVVESALKGFAYSSTETTSTVRRALLQSGSTYIWAISFTVDTSLSSTGASSADDFAKDINTELNSPSFQASVAEDLGVEVLGVSASTEVTDSGNSSSVKAAGLAWWAILLIVIASLVFVIGSAIAMMYVRNSDKAGSILKKFPFAIFSERRHFRNFQRDESHEEFAEINPLGESSPETFSGSSMIIRHDAL